MPIAFVLRVIAFAIWRQWASHSSSTLVAFTRELRACIENKLFLQVFNHGIYCQFIASCSKATNDADRNFCNVRNVPEVFACVNIAEMKLNRGQLD